MNYLEFWNKVSVAALLGTQRSSDPSPPEAFPASVADAWRDRTRESRLLATAAFTDVYLRAGMVVAQAEPCALSAAPAETLSVVDPRAHGSLALLLTGQFEEVLPQWLAAAVKAGKRVPCQHLPKLLNLAANDRSLAESIKTIVGQRGLWLAQRNKAWSEIFSTDESSIWETGTVPDRKAILLGRRALDPARARAMLETVWDRESADVRAAFMEVMWTGLSPADESFLNTACADRSKAVRSSAALLLMALAESAFARSLQARLETLLHIEFPKNRLLRKIGRPRLIAQLPQAQDAGADRWCPAVPGGSGLGERAWLLAQMMPAVVPRDWQHKWNLSAEEILTLADQNEFALALLHGWSVAAVIHRDVNWCAALIRAWYAANRVEADRHAPVRRLVGAMPPAERETVLQGVLGELMRGEGISDGLGLLEAADHDWSLPFSRFVVLFIRKIAEGKESKSELRHHPRIGLSIHPEVAALLAEITVDESTSGPGNTTWSHTVAMVAFRNQIFKELA